MAVLYLVRIGCLVAFCQAAIAKPQLDALADPTTRKTDTRQTEGDPDTVRTILLSDRPVTVRLPLDDRLRTAITHALSTPEPLTVRLAIRGVHVPLNSSVVGLKVFVNQPDATSATGQDDPGFAGAVVFPPEAARKPHGYYLDLSRTLRSLLDARKLDLLAPLRITFVPIIDRDAENAKELPTTIESISVTVPGNNGRKNR